MWPFPSRLITLSNGRQVTRRALRQQERQELRSRKARAKKTEALTDLEITRQRESYTQQKVDQKIERVHSRRAQRWATVTGAITRRSRAFRTMIAEDRPLLAALVVAGLCLVTTIGGQIMVYTSLDWHGWGWIAFALPLIVEGATWSFAIFAAYLAGKRLPYGRYTRLMWVFAAYAAGSNTYHFARDLHDSLTGALLGGASIVGPFVWHSYITLSRLTHAGRTAAQIRAALLQRVYHPILSARTTSLWSAGNATMTRDMAWRLIWEQAKGRPPGMFPTNRALPKRNRTLFRILFGSVSTIGSDTMTAALAEALRNPITATPRNPAQPSSEVAAQPDDQVAQPPSDEGATPLADEVAQYLERWSATPDATFGNSATATLELQDNPSSPEVAQPNATSAQPLPDRLRATQSNPGCATPATAADWVAQYYRNQVALGVAPADISATAAADYATRQGLRCSRQAAAKKIKQLIRHP
jgi:Protein of unknown function (DUF2637)